MHIAPLYDICLRDFNWLFYGLTVHSFNQIIKRLILIKVSSTIIDMAEFDKLWVLCYNNFVR